VFGGRGYMRDTAAERFFRELRVDRIWGGLRRSSGSSSPGPWRSGASGGLWLEGSAVRGKDHRPDAAFAPRSIAVVGASSGVGIAETVRDNLLVTGSPTRCHFVNPRYTELLGQPVPVPRRPA